MEENGVNLFAKFKAANTELPNTRALGKDARERRKVAQEFSSLLFLEVLKSMRAALSESGFGKGDALSRDIYTGMMDSEIARLMAKRDNTGFTRTIEKSLEKLTPEPQMGEAHSPTEGKVSSVFGRRMDPLDGKEKFHQGVDIAAPAGTPVKAVAAGKVVFAGKKGGYGNLIELDHGNGWVTRYAHNSSNLVVAGEEIQAGRAIALVGESGRATGNHLHFEVRKAGKPIDPGILLGEVSKGAKLSSVI